MYIYIENDYTCVSSISSVEKFTYDHIQGEQYSLFFFDTLVIRFTPGKQEYNKIFWKKIKVFYFTNDTSFNAQKHKPLV